jgi:hypothetical protein
MCFNDKQIKKGIYSNYSHNMQLERVLFTTLFFTIYKQLGSLLSSDSPVLGKIITIGTKVCIN